MKKLLTTITLLCFSVAANADIYFCEIAKYASAGPDDATSNENPTRETLIVDTDKGFRISEGEDYSGSCEQSADSRFFICQGESLPANLAINTEKLTFTYTSNLYSLGVAIARAGTCTKA